MPLHNAATRGSEELVCYLLNKGANAEALSMYYQTPLVCAMRARAVGIVRLLFTKVVSIHPRPLPQNYQSPLSAALYGIAHSDGRFNPKSLQIARILLEHDRTIMDDECNALTKGIRLRQMPAECREDLKAILRISGISQAQETGPSHTGLLEHGMLLRFAIYLLIISLGVRVILALRSETALF
ncbi:hypothetical protein BDV32DRAFT_118255 [Aspergillus pseudonomiae]|nr:hypothetical protein BDV32DRAFT_118255 [Aspergillus pseudonomiae]